MRPGRGGPEAWVLAIGFKAGIVGGERRPVDDVVEEVRWISAGGVDGTDFAWEHDREFVRAAHYGAAAASDRRSTWAG